MDSVTIRIEPQGPGETDFRVHLIEENGDQISEPLTRADLTRGPWTANPAAASPKKPAGDIVTHVADAEQNGRGLIRRRVKLAKREPWGSTAPRSIKNETPKMAHRRQAPETALASPFSARGDQATSAKCSGTTPF
jgi:hypothetical protein